MSAPDEAGLLGLDPDRRTLRPDCAACLGLCCVALPFSVSADFAIDKPAGSPCPHLGADHRCGIHDQLRDRGFAGCAAYDCFGAGQRVSQDTFGGQDWRQRPDVAPQMFEVFTIMRQLHEMLWYLAEAITRDEARPLYDEVRRTHAEIARRAAEPSEALLALDVAALRRRVGALLRRVSELIRAGPDAPAADRPDRSAMGRRGADLIGADLLGADLRRTDLSQAYLIGADLRGADLRDADLLGADLRGSRLAGADLRGSIFLTQGQLDAAFGDAATRLPATVRRPLSWLGALR
jgi:hypothetical protein